MPRRARIETPGCFHHVTGRGLGELTLFPDGRSREVFLGILGEVAVTEEWDVAAYCPLGTHHHLLVRGPARLGKGLQQLHGRFGAWRNRQAGRRGPVWGGRYHSAPIRDLEHLARAVLYIDSNPVDAGLVDDPRDWRWSSARANVGLDEAMPWHRPALAWSFVAATSGSDYGETLVRDVTLRRRTVATF